ncbi:malate dehydrogenase, cytoplasmic-like [Sorex araneus]|uniref:malate dehydrogenase, cytoplasmic-like n=1 Tax=Sorex araneus TaxID=42254 RepID=UPI002433D801|nr:malate dehydrogenase, cytoplasmic-like [Sorex araneus]
MAEPIRVLVSGAAGNVAHSLLYNLATGTVFGKEQPIILGLLDVPPRMGVLQGLASELQACALPLLRDVVATDVEELACRDLDVAILLSSQSRKEAALGVKDLLRANVKIYQGHGKALDKYAKRSVRVIVVGHPAHTNCLVASKWAPSIPRQNFTCLTRLDQHRAQVVLAGQLGVPVTDVKNVIIWGNHGSMLFPDASQATVRVRGRQAGVRETLQDDHWLREDFLRSMQPCVPAGALGTQAPRAMATAKAICDHVRDLWQGTPAGEFVSMGVSSHGNPYGLPDDLFCSFPVTVQEKTWKVVPGLPISDFSYARMEQAAKELIQEKEMALDLLFSDRKIAQINDDEKVPKAEESKLLCAPTSKA